MPKLKVLFVFNNCTWSSIREKVQQVRDFYNSKVYLECDIQQTNFKNIPFAKVKTLDGTGSQDGTDHIGTAETVQDDWYNKNLSIPNKSYDIIVFAISDSDKTGHITSAGIRADKDQGPVEIVMFGGNERDRCYVNGIDIGNSFVVFTCHEISHAIYMILGKEPDNTHLYFYSGRQQLVLNDFDFQTPKKSDKITTIQNLLIAIKKLLGIYKQELLNIETTMTNKIDLFCKAIESREGYIAPNAKYPKGTTAWRNKNPGNLRYANQTGSIGKDVNNFAIFPTYEEGFSALKRQVLSACKGTSKVFKPTDSILEFFQKYAPATDHNEPYSYASEVAEKVGVPVETQMKDLV